MKSKQKFFKLLDLAYYMGVEVEDIRSACQNHGIEISDGETLSHEQVKSLVGFLKHDDAQRGQELHLETGLVGHHVDRGVMRDEQGDEQGHIHTVHQWSKRLGVSQEILLNELSLVGYDLDASSELRLGVLSQVIDRLEIETRAADLEQNFHEYSHEEKQTSSVSGKKTHKEKKSCSKKSSCHRMKTSKSLESKKSEVTTPTSKISCSSGACSFTSSKNTETEIAHRAESSNCGTGACHTSASLAQSAPEGARVVDLAKQFGIPAVALMTWLNQRGITDTRISSEQAQEIETMINGKSLMYSSCELKLGVRENDSCETSIPKETHEEEHEVSGIVASSEDFIQEAGYTHYTKTGAGPVAWSKMNRLSAAAWTMLGLLAIPLGLFIIDSDSSAVNQLANGDVQTPVAVTELVEHGVNDLFEELDAPKVVDKEIAKTYLERNMEHSAPTKRSQQVQKTQNPKNKVPSSIDANSDQELEKQIGVVKEVSNTLDAQEQEQAQPSKIHGVTELPSTGTDTQN